MVRRHCDTVQNIMVQCREEKTGLEIWWWNEETEKDRLKTWKQTSAVKVRKENRKRQQKKWWLEWESGRDIGQKRTRNSATGGVFFRSRPRVYA